MDYSQADKIEIRLPEVKATVGDSTYTILDARERASPKGGTFWLLKLEKDGNRFSHTIWPDTRFNRYHWVELRRFLAAVAGASVDQVNAKMIAQAFCSGKAETDASPLVGKKVRIAVTMEPSKKDPTKSYPNVAFLPAS